MSDITQPVDPVPGETQPVSAQPRESRTGDTQPVHVQAHDRRRDPNGNGVIIYANGLAKEFRNEYAVRDVTFSIPRGKIFGFIGPSGSGKTTTIRMLTGYYAPSAGEVIVFDRPPTRFTQSLRERVGYMPQLFVLYPNLTVWENLNFAASIYGMSFARGKQLREVLDFVELYEHRGKLARNISGGMQRRLTLAATMVHNPELLFLDEPTAGVDPVLRLKFWDRFRDLRNQGRTLFVTTQYVSEAAYCDLVGIIDEGILIRVGTPEDLRKYAFGGEIVELRLTEPVDVQLEHKLYRLPSVKRVTPTGDRSLRLIVDEASTSMPEILDLCRDQRVSVDSIEEYIPPFDDVFVRLVRKEGINA